MTSNEFNMTLSAATLLLTACLWAYVQNEAKAQAFDSAKQIIWQTKDLLVDFNGIEMSGGGI